MASVWGLGWSDSGNILLREQHLKWSLENDGFLACGCGEGDLRVARHIDRIKHAGFALARNIYISDSAVGSQVGAVCVGPFSWGDLKDFRVTVMGLELSFGDMKMEVTCR